MSSTITELTELETAMDKVTKPLFENLDHGEEIKLTQNYVLYRYCEEDIYVINKMPECDEILQVMTADEGFVFEEL